MKFMPFTREVGRNEALSIELTDRSNGAVQGVAFFRVCMPVNVSLIKQAFSFVHQLHPMLRARVERGGHLQWRCDVDFSSIEFDVRILDGTLDFEREFYLQGIHPVILEKMSYRVTIYVNSSGQVAWIAVTVNHAAMDAISIVILFRYLDDYLKGKLCTPSKSLPFLQAVEQYLYKGGQEKKIPLPVAEEVPVPWLVEKPAAAPQRVGMATYRKIPAESIVRLHDLAKKHRVKLAALYSAVAIYAGKCLPNSGLWNDILLPVNIRSLCNPPISFDVIGEYISFVDLVVSPDLCCKSVMSLASLLQDKLSFILRRESLRLAEQRPEYKLAEIIEKADFYAAKKPNFVSGICISDVGCLESLVGELTFFDLRVAMTVQTHGAHPMMIATETTKSESIFSFGYCEPLTSRESALCFISHFMGMLNSLQFDS
ncbi:hypothetical protein [uncultured Microbulbifer sp.]|uniref:hypothetical protein n=1 Tax=uncultured Microbulbifer sp. TaxID=348147 RepID=UPI00262189B2|nr:hypothetical protein [uncultured Microbulbifer sp.]